MVTDLVIDTNVLVHASNKEYAKQKHCIDIINRLIASTETICVDDNGFIQLEYSKHVKPGMLGYTLLLLLLSAEPIRISFINRDIPATVNNKINRTGIKKSDRIFVRIAYKSVNKILVTHDYEDFTNGKRKYFGDEIGVTVLEAGEFMCGC